MKNGTYFEVNSLARTESLFHNTYPSPPVCTHSLMSSYRTKRILTRFCAQRALNSSFRDFGMYPLTSSESWLDKLVGESETGAFACIHFLIKSSRTALISKSFCIQRTLNRVFKVLGIAPLTTTYSSLFFLATSVYVAQSQEILQIVFSTLLN